MEEARVSHGLLMSSEDVVLARDLAEDRETTPGDDAVIEELLVEHVLSCLHYDAEVDDPG
jgi:hypothetical protein